MTRQRMLLTIGCAALVLTPAVAQQQPRPQVVEQFQQLAPLQQQQQQQTNPLIPLTQLVRRLPASTFNKQTAGVRGMALTVSGKLDPRLRDLVDASRGGSDLRSRSIDLGASDAALRVPVTALAADATRVAALTQEIRGLNGEIWATYDTTVWASLVPASIDRLAASANLHYLTVQEQMTPTQATPAGGTLDSIRATRVQALHRAGIRGSGVKVGIIDFGFQNYNRLQQAGKVPAPKKTAAFPSTQTFEGRTPHGTACAEIIYTMAPDADLYLASVSGTDGALMAAGQWLIEQGVDIISFSGGGTGGPTDGQNAMDRFVDDTTQRYGIVWIVAAGNSGDEHWTGRNQDRDQDGFVDTGETNEDVIAFVPGTNDISITVRWNDWGADARRPSSTQDVDAFLFVLRPGSGLDLVARGVDVQNGGSAPPVEGLRYKRASPEEKLFVLVLKNARTSRPLDVHVFVKDAADILPLRREGSVSSPASASAAVGVGAWSASTSAIADYSSRGPTDDNRLKPEIAAPAGLYSAAYGDVFHGTSAACPHVSGFAALLKSGTPSLKGQTLRAALLQAVEPKGTPVPNMSSGYGWIDGDRVTKLASAPPPAAAPPAAAGNPGGSAPPPRVSAATTRLTLPLAWGGSVSSEFLDRIRMPANEPLAFLTRVTTGRDLYRVGDGLKVGFKSSEQCDYLLFHRSSAGEYTLLSPRDGRVATLAPGAPNLLPAENETYQVALPVGVEELVLLCARQAVDLSAATGNARPPSGLVVSRHQYQVSQ